MKTSIKKHRLIGLGLDEATAVVVQGDTMEVIGKSYIAVYDYNTIIGKGKQYLSEDKEDYTASSGPFFFLSNHQKYDLKNRVVIASSKTTASVSPGENKIARPE